MGAEKHVMPILVIILVLVALISTYAWFATSTTNSAVVEIGSGEPTSFTITDGSGNPRTSEYEYGGSGDLDPNHKYSGQIGFKPDGSIYTDDNAPFIIYCKVPFSVSGVSQMTIAVNMEKLIVIVGEKYTYTLDQTLSQILGLAAEDYDTPEEKATYYVTSTAYATDSKTLPTSNNPIYLVYNESTSKVTHIIYTQSVVSQYMSYDYWLSSANAVEPVQNHGSGKSNGGISFVDNGSDQYMCVMIGFYGWDSTNNHATPCVFSGSKFRGSAFKMIMGAGGVS